MIDEYIQSVFDITLDAIGRASISPENQRKEEKLDVNKENPKRVLCVGTCILNIFHVCEGIHTDDHTRTIKGYWQRGGNASNNCTVLQLLGTCSEYFGVLSGRTAYKFLLQDFQEYGVIIENCPQLDIQQPYSSIFSCQYGKENVIVRSDTNPPNLSYTDFKERIKLTNYKWIHFEGRNPRETTPMINRIRRYNKENDGHITISVELAKPTYDILTLAMRVDLVFVGRQFASHIGWKAPKETVFSLRELLSILQLREDKRDSELDLCFCNSHLICPWAGDGVHVLTAQYEYYHIPPPPPIQVLDTIGAGATFVAAVIHGLISRNMSIREAVEFGTRVAAFKMQYRGLKCIRNYMISSGEAEKEAVLKKEESFEGNGAEENFNSKTTKD